MDFEVLAASSSEVFTRMELELRMNEYASERQVSASKSLPESMPEVCTEENPSWLSYSDCDAILDVTCENLSYYNSTKAEKDSDSDFDDTLIFEDAEECEASGRDENAAESCCRSSCCERSMDEVFERRLDDFDRTSEDGSSAPAASAIEIEDDGGVDAGDEALKVELQGDSVRRKEEDSGNRCEDVSHDGGTDDKSREVDEAEKMKELEAQKDDAGNDDDEKSVRVLRDTDIFVFSSDSEEDIEKKLIYSSPNVATSYLEFRESIRDPKFEATLDQPGVGITVNDGAMGTATLEEVEATEAEETSTTGQMTDEDATDVEEKGNIPVQDGQVIMEEENKLVGLSSPQDYLEKLAEITESSCPRTEEEVQQTLKRIAEGKAEIESRKSEALKDLSVEFNEFEKLVAEQRAFEEKCPATEAKFSESEESLDKAERRTDAIEMPLTKDQVAESFKIKTMPKSVVDEERRRTELLQECLQVIPQTEEAEEVVDSIGSEVTMKSEVKLEEEKDNVARIFATISSEMAEEKAESSAETSKEAARPAAKVPSTIVKDIISDTEDSLFWEMCKEPERTYIKGKVYDFDKKKHGVRYN